jgi:hypothetical protein
MAKRRKSARPAKKRSPSDKALINECVIYAQAKAAEEAGFKADPDDDAAHAALLADRHIMRAMMVLDKITKTPATTAAGLQAKARIVPIVVGHFTDIEVTALDRDFLVSFGADVKAFLAPIIHEQWLAARAVA